MKRLSGAEKMQLYILQCIRESDERNGPVTVEITAHGKVIATFELCGPVHTNHLLNLGIWKKNRRVVDLGFELVTEEKR